MNIPKTVIKSLCNPAIIISYLGTRGRLRWLPDKTYLKLRYRACMGKKLDLNNPKTYNEKLQWLKINDRKEIYTTLVDKYEVREYVKESIGEEYLIPLINVYTSVEDINFKDLPQRYVLKTTHDSGGVVICKDKSILDVEKVKEKLNKHLKKNYFYVSREWPYKNVTPRIVCEEFICESNEIPDDYKFMCFHGEPKIIQFHTGRFESHKQFHYNMEGELLDFNNIGYSNEGAPKLNMKIISEMLPLVEKLCKEFTQIRIDFYYVKNKIYFGELTFFDAGGFAPIIPEEYDYLLGDWIKVPVKNKK